MIRCDCGSYAVNDDPEKQVCDKCWRDRKVRQAIAERDEARRSLASVSAEADELRLRVVELEEQLRGNDQ